MLIIEALKQKEYIQVIKNKLVVTEKGKLLCQAVESQHLLTSAEMTAKWETYLKKIGKREGNQENFINNILILYKSAKIIIKLTQIGDNLE